MELNRESVKLGNEILGKLGRPLVSLLQAMGLAIPDGVWMSPVD